MFSEKSFMFAFSLSVNFLHTFSLIDFFESKQSFAFICLQSQGLHTFTKNMKAEHIGFFKAVNSNTG